MSMNEKRNGDTSTGEASPTLAFEEPTIFEHSHEGKCGYSLPENTFGDFTTKPAISKNLLRHDLFDLPEVSEPEIVRHFTRLSQWNYSVDTGFYPLGSCTMKYNPRINEKIATLDGFASLHPFSEPDDCQGTLEVMKRLEELLCAITGLDHFTLQPLAGAHGELTGMKIIAAYQHIKDPKRNKVLIPDTAHGTNPASCALANLEVVQLKTTEDGILSPAVVREALQNGDVAAMMITNPNTLGLFETHIREIADLLHENGALLYMDGANYNALMGISSAALMGVDVLHLNLHKTFSTPHGGGGPGSGPVGVTKALFEFLPIPYVVRNGAKLALKENLPLSIGRVAAFYGNFFCHLRALAYILTMGKTDTRGSETGLRTASELAIVNANYIRARLKGRYHLPFDKACMHECVFTDALQQKYDIHTRDIAKRLMDYGFHPPTIYFPLVVEAALMIEPTETETKETLDAFCDAMIAIADEAKSNPARVLEAPTLAKRKRIDQLKAVREPVLRWRRGENST